MTNNEANVFTSFIYSVSKDKSQQIGLIKVYMHFDVAKHLQCGYLCSPDCTGPKIPIFCTIAITRLYFSKNNSCSD